MHPIVNFQATTIWKAFILNSIASTLIIFVAMSIKDRFDKFYDQKGNVVTRSTSVKSVIATLLVTFLSCMIAYTTLYLIFGFGRGMLAV